MPPLGTKLPPKRAKKPPSCDHCKLKRVLCHPSPAGCPRCVEKGIDCTTTPVVRRKPARRTHDDSRQGSVAPSVSASVSSRAPTVEPLDLRVPPPTRLPTPPIPNSYCPPIASTSSFIHDPSLVPHFDAYQLVSLHYPPSSLAVSPELAQQLFKAFGQCPQHEHPVLAAYSLERTLRSLGWRVELLPSHSSVLAYCIFAVGSLLSFDPSILDPYHFNFGSACPDSFRAILEHLPDLRQFGKLRSAAASGYREEALRRAKESDILFVASEEAATACHLLTWLEAVSPGGNRASCSVWHVAGMNHLRILGRPNIPEADLKVRWACYMLVDAIQALFNAEAPPSSADQNSLVGPAGMTEIAVDCEVERTHKVETDGWPLMTPHLVLALELCRTISNEFEGSWRPDQTFDFVKTMAILDSLERRKRCAAQLVGYLEPHVAVSTPSQHFPNFSTRDPHTRYKTDQVTSMRSLRTIVQSSWSYLTLVVYEKLRQRQGAWATPSSSADANDRYLKSRLDFCVAEARRLALEGLDATVESFRRLACLALWTHTLPRGLERWSRFILGELSEGLVVMDSRIVSSLETLSSGLKQCGYVWSSPALDSLILNLDSQVLAFRLASSSSSSSSSSAQPPFFSGDTVPTTTCGDPSTTSFSQSLFAAAATATNGATASRAANPNPDVATNDHFGFDPNATSMGTLFANLTAISTPSTSTDHSPSSHGVDQHSPRINTNTTATTTTTRTSSSSFSSSSTNDCARGGLGGLAGGCNVNGSLEDLSHVLGLY